MHGRPHKMCYLLTNRGWWFGSCHVRPWPLFPICRRPRLIPQIMNSLCACCVLCKCCCDGGGLVGIVRLCSGVGVGGEFQSDDKGATICIATDEGLEGIEDMNSGDSKYPLGFPLKSIPRNHSVRQGSCTFNQFHTVSGTIT